MAQAIQRKPSMMLSFVGGMDSFTHPSKIQQGQYQWGLNVLNRGDIVQTRPGYKIIKNIPEGYMQGFTVFTDINGNSVFLFAVNGLIYSSAPASGDTFTQITTLAFSANAKRVEFCNTVRSVRTNEDGSVTIITPYPVCIIQDGQSAPGYFDGANAGHVDPRGVDANSGGVGTPVGLWMCFTDSRLWVSSGNAIFASDILDPLTFTEGKLLAQADSFRVDGDVTGMIATSGDASLLVFTEEKTYQFMSSIIDRTQWQSTPNFQQLLLSDVGCVAGRSVFSQYGVTFWYSRRGLVSLDIASQTKISSKMSVMDNQMMRSKGNMSSNSLDVICGISYENLLLLSVPSGSLSNAHTWVMDQSASDTQQAPPCWASVWSGISPSQWVIAKIGNEHRIFCIARDSVNYQATHNRMWEIMQDDRLDNGGPILCQLETGAITLDADFIRFRYAEIDIEELCGDVSLKVYFAGLKGGYNLILDTTLQAEKGSIGSFLQPTIDLNSVIQSFAKQSRTVRTNEVVEKNDSGASDIESPYRDCIDKSFSLLIQWQGQMAVRAVSIYCDQEKNASTGRPVEPESGKHNIILGDGTGVKYP